ncbi:M10 family metallopeptidase C-terminal domain-containing protein [Microvirga sp. BT688]|uniref:calcium-binding protein n=1 Tax=Microvirga sp. TaxID=1873136 RepID=UPI001689B6A3|nr:calcium-binding protein [Microvirga sp.]MBD2748293.1 M10 family metallopeptidase C-terminal domain-containing protein [Microvirga sp.]
MAKLNQRILKTKPTQTPPESEKFSIVVDGTDGKDVLFATRGHDTINGGADNDLLFGLGNRGGADGHDRLYGGAGDDTLVGGPGDDLLDGGEGVDTAVLSTDVVMWIPKVGARVDLALSGAQNTRVGTKTFVSIENLIGTLKADTLKGNDSDNSFFGDVGHDALWGRAGHDVLDGGIGNDRLHGGDGDDLLIGGLGQDRLTGGSGNDTFAFTLKAAKGGNVDVVTDFKSGEDKIKLSGPDLSSFKEGDFLAEKAFHVGAQARDGETRVFYNEDNGTLFFDADGTGAQAAVQIAKLSKSLGLTHTDLVL